MHKGVMGPSKFLNITDESFFAPWGIWTLFHCGEDGITKPDLVAFSHAFHAAKLFTHNYNEHNRAHATRLCYTSCSNYTSE